MSADRWVIGGGALFGLTGVILGALGAHAVEADAAWRTAVQYHLVHSVAMIALGGLFARFPGRLVALAGGAFALGIVLFSGSLYLLALGGPRLLGPVTPVGGLAFIAGWALIAAAAFRR